MNNKITYHKEGDYYIPDLYLEKDIYKNSAEEIIFKEIIYV